MNTRSYLLTSFVALLLPLAASAETINIGFFNPAQTSVLGGETWNRLSSSAIVTPASLVDSTGASTGISVTSTTTMQFTYHAQTFTGLDSNIASHFIYNTSGTPSFTFSGLDSDFTYSFSVYALRIHTGSDIRTGLYTATGSNTESGVLDASNNTSTVLHLLNVSPDENGSIVFTMAKDVTNNNASGYFYLNGLTIEATPSTVPEPSTFAGLLGLGALGYATLRRRHRTAS